MSQQPPTSGQPDPHAGHTSAQGQPNYQQQYQQGQQYHSQQPGRDPNEMGFIQTLLDLDFRSLVTVRFCRVLYSVLLVVVSLMLIFGWIVAGITMIADPYQSTMRGIYWLVFGWIPPLMVLGIGRVFLEFFITTIRTAENTARTAQQIEHLRADYANQNKK